MNHSKKFHTLMQKIVGKSAIFLICIVLVLFPLGAHASEGIVFKVNVVATAQCFNGIDDDSDGLIDDADTGCSDPADDQELNSSDNTSSGGGGGGSSVPSITEATTEATDSAPLIDPENSISIDIPTDILSPDWEIDLNAAPSEPEDIVTPSAPEKTPLKVEIPLSVSLAEPEEIVSILTHYRVPPVPYVGNLPLFDVISDFKNVPIEMSVSRLVWRVAPGDLLPISVKLSNFGGGRRVDVLITYSIFTTRGEEIYTSSETVAVETTVKFIKTLQVPLGVEPGIYTAKTSILSPGQLVPAISSFPFNVERKIFCLFQSDFLFIEGIILLLSILLLVFDRIFMKRRRNFSQK